MDDAQQSQNEEPAPARTKRSSRKGLPKRFMCQSSGCHKQYSRAEHLQRHSLNHEPKRIHRCRTDGCRQTFVRQDLFDRHVERHRHRDDSWQSATDTPSAREDHNSTSVPSQNVVETHHPATRSVSLQQQPEENLISQAAMAMADWDFLAQPFENGTSGTASGNDSLAAWLLSPPGSHGWDLDVTQPSFMNYNPDNGSCNPFDASNLAFLPASDQHGDSVTATWVDGTENAASVGSLVLPQQHHVHISARRLGEILDLLQTFHRKHAPSLKLTIGSQSLVYRTPDGVWPNVTLLVLEQCVASFWKDVASQMPILHQPTFSANHCPVLLLLAIIPLGAAQLVRLASVEIVAGYRDFADLIIMGLRWEIQSNEAAQPPVNLWVAQALLLLEFYEKMFSSRQLHERAHIHHVSTLTLLRRGSPLGGRLGTETPLEVDEMQDLPDAEDGPIRSAPTCDSWWHRWSSNEAMLRVIFAAYEMDTLHAAMFGHESSLLPSDVGLPLPCDDVLWVAETPESMHALETSFHLCGVKTTKFLDGLKNCLHGHAMQSHYRARLTLVIGLLSVACNLRPREKHIKLFETVPSQTERKKWTQMMFRALDQWKEGLDGALSSLQSHRPGHVPSSMVIEPTVLFHLTYITTHVDILYCQILAGTRLLLGRRVSRKELASAKSYAATWATTSEARLAVLHSARLLAETLLAQRPTMQDDSSGPSSTDEYSCRSDPCIYRPWSLYLAALTIWTYQYTASPNAPNEEITESLLEHDVEIIACSHIASLAESRDVDQLTKKGSNRGCSAVLQYLSVNLATAETEILVEASSRLGECCKLLATPFTPHHSRMDPSSP